MAEPKRISFYFILAVLVLTGWLGLGVLLLSILFSYFAITKLNFLKTRHKWPALTLFLALLAGLAYGLAFFVQATAAALPGIAEKSVPAIIQWANEHHIKLPFTDFESLKDEAIKLGPPARIEITYTRALAWRSAVASRCFTTALPW